MMPYYPTLAEDLARAKEILAKGLNNFDVGLPDIVQGGTIYGADTYAAYKLLESFVEEIEARGEQIKSLTHVAAGWQQKAHDWSVENAELRVSAMEKRSVHDHLDAIGIPRNLPEGELTLVGRVVEAIAAAKGKSSTKLLETLSNLCKQNYTGQLLEQHIQKLIVAHKDGK